MAPNKKFLGLIVAKYHPALGTAWNTATTIPQDCIVLLSTWPNIKNSSLFIILLYDANFLQRQYSSRMRRMNERINV
jgi:hypothetical protein